MPKDDNAAKNPAVFVLRAVAQELAEMAKAAMPKLQDGEQILKESYSDGVYSRVTTLDEYRYSFKERGLV